MYDCINIVIFICYVFVYLLSLSYFQFVTHRNFQVPSSYLFGFVVFIRSFAFAFNAYFSFIGKKKKLDILGIETCILSKNNTVFNNPINNLIVSYNCALKFQGKYFLKE